MLAAIAESVVGAAVIRAYGVHGRTEERLDTAIERQPRRPSSGRMRTSVSSFSSGELAAGLAPARSWSWACCSASTAT